MISAKEARANSTNSLNNLCIKLEQKLANVLPYVNAQIEMSSKRGETYTEIILTLTLDDTKNFITYMKYLGYDFLPFNYHNKIYEQLTSYNLMGNIKDVVQKVAYKTRFLISW